MLALSVESVSAAKAASEARTDTMNNLNDLIIGVRFYTILDRSQQVFFVKRLLSCSLNN